MTHQYKYIFGPVPSRRLGLSLGVDLLPRKACTYNCIYCQVGITDKLTCERREWVSTEDVRNELELKLSLDVRLDYITFSGSGEPTLHLGLGTLLEWLRDSYKHRTAVLTNGSLLWDDDVRATLESASLVVPSMDAADEETWRRINRPCDGLTFEMVMSGLRDFCASFKGQKWLEILLVAGVNDTPQHLRALAKRARTLNVEKVQVHTVTRPPAKGGTASVPADTLAHLASMIGEHCEVVHSSLDHIAGKNSVDEADIIALVSRRPCTALDIAIGLGVDFQVALRVANLMAKTRKLRIVTEDGSDYYALRE